MLTTTRRKTTAAALLAATVLCGAFAVSTTSASAADDRTPASSSSSQVSSGGGAVDLDGRPVETRTYVGDTPPADLGTLECSATVSVDGTVSDRKGDCDDLVAAAG